MIKEIPKNSTMVSDTDTPDNAFSEQPVIVSFYEGDGSIGLITYEGQEAYIPYRMVKEVIKVMQSYYKQFKA